MKYIHSEIRIFESYKLADPQVNVRLIVFNLILKYTKRIRKMSLAKHLHAASFSDSCNGKK